VTKTPQEKLARRVLLTMHPRESGPEVEQRLFGVVTSPIWLGVEPKELSKVVEDREVFRVLLGILSPRSSPEEKRVYITNRTDREYHKNCTWVSILAGPQPERVNRAISPEVFKNAFRF